MKEPAKPPLLFNLKMLSGIVFCLLATVLIYIGLILAVPFILILLAIDCMEDPRDNHWLEERWKKFD
jgi:hypothetical protein